jgi:hypothetical protein
VTYLEPTVSGIRLRLHVQPRASRTELAGLHGDALKVRLTAPPVDGAANAEILRFVAALLQVPRSTVTLASGTSSRRKVVEVEGISVATATARLNLCSTP